MTQEEKVQPTRISKEEYIKFKQFVQDTHDTTRGHLATELENALREYRQPKPEAGSLTRIEDELATIKAQVCATESDGGSTLSESNTRAHADNKPEHNAPRQEKVDYIVSKYYGRDGGSATVGVIKSHIQSEYNFKAGVIDEYVDMIVTELDAKKHPERSGTFVWGKSLEQAKQELREQAEQEVEEKL